MPPIGSPGRGTHRDALHINDAVWVVQKNDQRTGTETLGRIRRLLTNSNYHPRGIKVMLMEGGIVGRVTRIVSDEEASSTAIKTETQTPTMSTNATATSASKATVGPTTARTDGTHETNTSDRGKYTNTPSVSTTKGTYKNKEREERAQPPTKTPPKTQEGFRKLNSREWLIG